MKLKFFLFGILLSFMSMKGYSQEKQMQIDEISKVETLTKKGLYEQIIKHGIKFPDVVFAQAMIESGDLTSRLFKSANNMFGMKFPGSRKTTAIGKTKGGYSKYEHWNFGVYDYFLWQDYVLRKKNNITKSQYLEILGRVYAKDPNYVGKVKQKILQYKHILN